MHRQRAHQVENHHYGCYAYACSDTAPTAALRASEAAQRLFPIVVKRHPKLDKKLPPWLNVKSKQEDAEKFILRYLAVSVQKVEDLLPDHEGAIRDKLHITKEILEDERLLANKGIRSAVDPDEKFG